jgi:hypothetical protein
MSPAKKKKAAPKRPAPAKAPSSFKQRKPQEILVVSEQPVRVTTVTQPPSHKADIWTALATVRQSLFYGFWIGVGLTPIGAHIISQFYCGVAEKLRCNPVEFPAWMEAGGIVVALIFANASKDVVSKSARQLAEAARGWLPWKNGKADESAPPAGGG